MYVLEVFVLGPISYKYIVGGLWVVRMTLTQPFVNYINSLGSSVVAFYFIGQDMEGTGEYVLGVVYWALTVGFTVLVTVTTHAITILITVTTRAITKLVEATLPPALLIP